MTFDYDEQIGSPQEFEDFLQYREELDYGWRHPRPNCVHVNMPEAVPCDKPQLIDERYCLLHLAEHMAVGRLIDPPAGQSYQKGYEGCACPCHFGDPVAVGRECTHCDPYNFQQFDH